MDGGQRLISWLYPFSTSNVALNTRPALMGHSWAIQIGPGVTFTPLPPSKNPTSSSVQLNCLVPTHTPCCVPHPDPNAHAYVRTLTRENVQEPSLLAQDRTSSANPYAMSCVPSQAHTCHAPYVRTLTCVRDRKGRL
jgi:hypothetical protein